MARALHFCKAIGKTPIVINDGYGFYTTRVFSSYLMEGAQLVAEGHDPNMIEWAARSAGMVIGPLQVFDEVSLTLGCHAMEQGEKYIGKRLDFAGAELVKKMVHDLNLPIEIVACPTVREADGLALSSRNRYLSSRQRADAVGLYVGLEEVRRLLHAGERSSARLRASVRRVWKRFPLLREEYVAVVDADTMQTVRKVSGRVLVAVAARVGRARLIDNFEWEPR